MTERPRDHAIPVGGRRAGLVLPLALAATCFASAAPSVAQLCNEPRVISDAAAEAVIVARMSAIFLDAEKRVLNAIIERRLHRLGFMPTPSDEEIARQHIEAIERGPEHPADAAMRDIHWPSVDLVLLHPAKWQAELGFVSNSSSNACAQYAERLPCEADDPVAATKRGLARSLLIDAGACRSGIVPHTLTAAPEAVNLRQYFDLLIAADRFLRQHDHLADLNNTPFRRPGLQYQMLYTDFFQKALQQGAVGNFARDYTDNSNPLSRHRLHRATTAIIGLLLVNRIIN